MGSKDLFVSEWEFESPFVERSELPGGTGEGALRAEPEFDTPFRIEPESLFIEPGTQEAIGEEFLDEEAHDHEEWGEEEFYDERARMRTKNPHHWKQSLMRAKTALQYLLALPRLPPTLV